MGCVSSNLLSQDDDLSQFRSTALSHHIVSLTSTTYGLLNLDPPLPRATATTSSIPPQRFTLGSIFPDPLTEPRTDPEVINSWELMAGLDPDRSFRFCPKVKGQTIENSNPNLTTDVHINTLRACKSKTVLNKFERLCPPEGENKVVIYTTTLRGIPKTYEACNSVKSVMENFGVVICERDISMDRGFKEELRVLMRNKEGVAVVQPRVFVKGRYVGGAEEVLRIVEEGWFGELIEGIPKRKVKGVCEGCGDVRFLPCFGCNGSCKMVMNVKEDVMKEEEEKQLEGLGRSVVVRCPDCNENGLVLCTICS